jgi:hypothetical protein
MSYYILPKNINTINVKPNSSELIHKPFITVSLLNYYNQIKKQIIEMFISECDLSHNSFDEAIRLVNPYEFLFTKVPGSKFSVSKLKPKTNIFYDLIEIFNNNNIFYFFKNTNPIKIIHISPNFEDSIECFEIYREEYNDSHICIENIDINNDILKEMKAEFIFYETTSDKYIYSFVQALIIILKNQDKHGNCIIKINDTFNKPIIDILYYLSSLYDRVYISKPTTNNIISFDKYIICINFLFDETENYYLRNNYSNLILFLKRLENKNITQILDFNIPCYFKNKIDDFNNIIGQQQLEAFDQIINIYKNKNKSDKIENVKKNNIQKSISWCEKYSIPCNKFADKINIFLPVINETKF